VRKIEMKKYILEIKWALIFVVMSLLWMVLEKISGLHSTHIDKHYYLTNLFAIPAVLVYVLALRDKKKNYYGNNMNFKQGFIAGILITLIVAALSPLTQWIITFIITPEYFPNVIAYSVKTGYHKTLEEAQQFFSYRNYAIQSVVGALFIGTITSLITTLFLRTKISKGTK